MDQKDSSFFSKPTKVICPLIHLNFPLFKKMLVFPSHLWEIFKRLAPCFPPPGQSLVIIQSFSKGRRRKSKPISKPFGVSSQLNVGETTGHQHNIPYKLSTFVKTTRLQNLGMKRDSMLEVCSLYAVL